jgi:hypothetical protein
LVDSKCFQIKFITNTFFFTERCHSIHPISPLRVLTLWLCFILITSILIFASQGLLFGSPFSPPLADLEYILKFARNAIQSQDVLHGAHVIDEM